MAQRDGEFSRRATGDLGERLAARFLEAAGHEILDRNWRAGRAELDLVTRIGDVVAFVEVKTRRDGVQAAAEGLSPAQRRRLRRASEAWIHSHPGIGAEFRFDVVAVELDGRGVPSIEHIPDAFYGDDCV